ncbi:uncharacterized protein LAESUDRAFT_732562 [Laetiporus sulphureus 93-53]|uniref:Uncharacterized protein n=1 Tax=Laetiporus sulphureus 93-53 TaxID=1314785 RepID=A0A165B2N2_9APHY|nr:uncharacterized protein LAESUDRAFT_732562 [Laetiporus sulphureus 93-53]KZT00110.1 hypothetical protein LAESUDRAFT_732562 [Laetiporus sulphureus 93-53]
MDTTGSDTHSPHTRRRIDVRAHHDQAIPVYCEGCSRSRRDLPRCAALIARQSAPL